MQQNYTYNERYFIVLLSLLSLSGFYPVVYALGTVHKNRGFDIVFCFSCAFTTFIYKMMIALDKIDFFISIDSWHKLSNITLLTQFLSLIIYLARIPKYAQGYLFGIGMTIIIVMQEKDSFSFKYACVPMIFNNAMLIISQYFIKEPVYVNNRMVVFGLIWYLASIVFFMGAFHKLIDLFYIFDDLFLFATGLSLFYSWQTYEKNDLTFTKFISEQWNIFQILSSYMDKKQLEEDYEIKRYSEEKSKLKQEHKKKLKKQQKQNQLNKNQEEDEDDSETGNLLEDQEKVIVEKSPPAEQEIELEFQDFQKAKDSYVN